MDKIPVTITVSRETGQIVGVECGNVTDETFRKVCRALMGKEGNHAAACGDSNRTGNGDPGYSDCERTT